MDLSKEIMYDQNSILIVSILFGLILLANEAGFRIGRYYQKRSDRDVKSQTNTIQSGILGLLALLLGFTFNMALNRYNNRSQAVIHEANTIGTALLRTELLPTPYDSAAAHLLHKYVDLRIVAGKLDLTRLPQRLELGERTDSLQHLIWNNAIMAARSDPRAVTTGYYIAALNNMIDARGERNAFLQLHVPEVILFLLFIVFITSGALMGYTSGLGHKRTYFPTVLMTFLIALVVFIIIDLDRPVRGIVKVNQDTMLELQVKDTAPQL